MKVSALLKNRGFYKFHLKLLIPEIIKEYENSAIIRTFDGEYYRYTIGKFEKLGASVDSRLTTTLMWDRVFDIVGVEK